MRDAAFESVQLHVELPVRRETPSVRAELKALAVQTGGEHPLPAPCIPADVFTVPSASDQIRAVRAEASVRGPGLVPAQHFNFAGLRIHALHGATMVRHDQPASV